MNPFIQLDEVVPTCQHNTDISATPPQFYVICNLAEGTLCHITQIINENVKQDQTQNGIFLIYKKHVKVILVTKLSIFWIWFGINFSNSYWRKCIPQLNGKPEKPFYNTKDYLIQFPVSKQC